MIASSAFGSRGAKVRSVSYCSLAAILGRKDAFDGPAAVVTGKLA